MLDAPKVLAETVLGGTVLAGAVTTAAGAPPSGTPPTDKRPRAAGATNIRLQLGRIELSLRWGIDTYEGHLLPISSGIRWLLNGSC